MTFRGIISTWTGACGLMTVECQAAVVLVDDLRGNLMLDDLQEKDCLAAWHRSTRLKRDVPVAATVGYGQAASCAATQSFMLVAMPRIIGIDEAG